MAPAFEYLGTDMTFGEFKRYVDRLCRPELHISGYDWRCLTSGEKDIDIKSFAKKLATNKTLTSLSLTHIKLRAASVVLLADALKKNTVLQSFAIQDIKILDEGVFAIAEALEANKTLHSLTLGGTGMGAAGVKQLCSALKVNRSLKDLDLSGNFEGLGDAGFKSLGALLGTNETALTSLHLGSSHVGPDGIAHLAEGLYTNTTLISLNLHNLVKTAFSSGKSLESFAALCAALVRNTTLCEIDMRRAYLGPYPGPEAVKLLRAVLPYNDSLRQLTIANASLSSQVRRSRKKIALDDRVPHAVATWLEKWNAPAAADPASAGPSGTKKRKRMTEAERLRAAL